MASNPSGSSDQIRRGEVILDSCSRNPQLAEGWHVTGGVTEGAGDRDDRAQDFASLEGMRVELRRSREREVESAREAGEWRAAAGKLRAIIEAMPNGILVVNRDGIISQANRAAERMFGYGSAELGGSRSRSCCRR